MINWKNIYNIKQRFNILMYKESYKLIRKRWAEIYKYTKLTKEEVKIISTRCSTSLVVIKEIQTIISG